MFVFYFGVLSALTPPVATGAFTAAALAGSDPDRTGWQSLRLALSGFIAPFLFIYDPRLLPLNAGGYVAAIEPFARAILGLAVLSAAIEGYWSVRLSMPVRIAMGIASIPVMLPDRVTNLVSLGVIIALLAYHFLVEKKSVALKEQQVRVDQI